MNFSKFLTEYFVKYASVNTQSDASKKSLPSSEGQKKLLDIIKADLESFGVADLKYQDDAVLIAKIPQNTDARPISFMAHVDTVDIGASPDVKPQVVEFTGDDIVLNKERNIVFKVSEHPDINAYKNQEIIMTDGTSVLGADDKAGVTVMTALAKYLMTENIPHGDVYLIFAPDEEVGLRGAYALDVSQLPKDVLSYTIDGGPVGEFGYENFNGAGVEIYIKGVSIHPGQAKGILVNPILVANDIIAKLDKLDTPEHSEGKEGFFLVTGIKGGASDAEIQMIIRDFDKAKFEERKTHLKNIVAEVQKAHPKAEISIDISDSYANIASTMGDDKSAVELVETAMKNIGVPIRVEPIRGGTDGAVLSVKGIPTPNLFTGAHEIHSVLYMLMVRRKIRQDIRLILQILLKLGKK